MYDLATIKMMNKEAGDKARVEEIRPFVLSTTHQIEEMPPFPFPNVGDMEIENELITTLFCDKSGFGAPDEPALTIRQLKESLVHLLEEHGPLLTAIVEDGQFQLYLNIWKTKNEGQDI